MYDLPIDRLQTNTLRIRLVFQNEIKYSMAMVKWLRTIGHFINSKSRQLHMLLGHTTGSIKTTGQIILVFGEIHHFVNKHLYCSRFKVYLSMAAGIHPYKNSELQGSLKSFLYKLNRYLSKFEFQFMN